MTFKEFTNWLADEYSKEARISQKEINFPWPTIEKMAKVMWKEYGAVIIMYNIAYKQTEDLVMKEYKKLTHGPDRNGCI